MDKKEILNNIKKAALRTIDPKYNKVWTRVNYFEIDDFDNEHEMENVTSKIDDWLSDSDDFNNIGINIIKFDYKKHGYDKCLFVEATYADYIAL